MFENCDFEGVSPTNTSISFLFLLVLIIFGKRTGQTLKFSCALCKSGKEVSKKLEYSFFSITSKTLKIIFEPLFLNFIVFEE